MTVPYSTILLFSGWSFRHFKHKSCIVSFAGMWGMPTFSVGVFMGMMSATICSTIDSVGDYYAVARACDAPPPPKHAINRGIAMEGLASAFCGFFGVAHATTTSSSSIGFIPLTGVRTCTQHNSVFFIYIQLQHLIYSTDKSEHSFFLYSFSRFHGNQCWKGQQFGDTWNFSYRLNIIREIRSSLSLFYGYWVFGSLSDEKKTNHCNIFSWQLCRLVFVQDDKNNNN